ncbi:MAG: MBL fold metallo-hydrolase [Thermoplasmata archaeon]|nr:MBL fold metallo-hydrolase [Thermoplasmata archaeon]
MIVRPVCSDSMGVRSLCVFVETEDLAVLIDPSAALGPSRYGLPPVPEEWEALDKFKREIREKAMDCDAFVISHYHYDHHDPDENFWAGKKVFVKDPKKNINRSQKERAAFFFEKFDRRAELVICDGQEFGIGNTKISFSRPLPHGNERSKLGFVVATRIEAKGEVLVHASDVQGPIVEESADILIEMEPDILVIDGPPSYFLGWKFSARDLERANANMVRIVEKTGARIILDHHLLRDLAYRERCRAVYDHPEIYTFAEFLGMENRMLEANRKFLHG